MPNNQSAFEPSLLNVASPVVAFPGLGRIRFGQDTRQNSNHGNTLVTNANL